MKIFRYVAIGVIALGVLLYVGNIFATRKGEIKRRPFTLTTAKFKIYNNNPMVLEYVATRFARSSSSWKEIITDVKTQAVRTQMARDGGVYQLKNDKQEWLSKVNEQEEMYTHENMLNHPQYVRTEQLFGLTVYVHRHQINSDNWSEMWFAPETGRIPLKIHISYNGGKEQSIVEPMSLTFGEIPDGIFDGPGLPVSFELIDELIKKADQEGNKEYAEAMRRSVAEAKSKNN